MPPGSLVSLISLISSVMAIYPFSKMKILAANVDYNVGCGRDVYSITELQQATFRGCKSLLNRYHFGGAGNCVALKKYVSAKLYTGPGFENYDKEVYVWGLPMRERSYYVYKVLFNIDLDDRFCNTLGASYRDKDGDGIYLCHKLQLLSYNNIPKSKSPPQQRPESHSQPPGRW